MALFQPTNITPSDLSGVGTIDALNDLPVTWQVNGTGNTPMTAYQIDIMMNDTESTMLYSTGQVALSNPFYGADAMGNPQYFTATITAAALAAAGVVNSKDNVYKLLITQWWSAGEYVQQSSASVFIARETPEVSITNFSPTITTVSYEFIGSYSQAQGDPIEWARWQISGSANNDVLVDTGRIYGVGELKTSYDGFLNGNNYIVRLSGQTVNGAEFDTGWQTFVAEYDIEILDGAMTTCVRKDTDAVQISFPTPLYTMGAGGGDWEIEDYQYKTAGPSDMVTVDDAIEAPIKSLKVDIEPVQDLHGFSSPWPAGGGANQLKPNVNLPMTQNGVTITLEDGVFVLNGQCTQTFDFPFDNWQSDYVTFNGVDGMQTFGFTMSGENLATLVPPSGKCGLFEDGEPGHMNDITFFSGSIGVMMYTGSSIEYHTRFYITITSGSSFNNARIKVGFYIGQTPSEWSPYENICPISGVSEAEAIRTGKNLLDFITRTQNGIVGTKSNGVAHIEGTATATAYPVDFVATEYPAGTYVWSISELPTGVQCQYTKNGAWAGFVTQGATLILTEPTTIGGYVSVASGTAVDEDIRIHFEKGTIPSDLDSYQGDPTRVSVTFPAFGKNLLNIEAGTHNAWSFVNIPNNLEPNTQYTFSINGETTYYYTLYLGNSDQSTRALSQAITGGGSSTFTTPSDMSSEPLLAVAGNASGAGNEDLSNVLPQVELGATKTSYESYTNTVYSGKMTIFNDGSATLVLDMAKKSFMTFDGLFGPGDNGTAVYAQALDGLRDKTFRSNPMCNLFVPSNQSYQYAPLYSYMCTSGANTTWTFILPSTVTTIDEANSWIAAQGTPIEFTYALADPLTFSLTTEQVTTLLGTNNIWSDAGQVTVEYAVEERPSLILPTNADSVTWDTAGSAPFSISAPFGIAWRALLTDASASLPLFSVSMASGVLNAVVSSAGVNVTISGQLLFEDTTTLENGDDVLLYIQRDSWALIVNGEPVSSGALQNWQDEITGVMLYGPQDCMFMWIVDNAFTMAQMLKAQNNEPTYDSTTHFLAQFNDGLSAGAIRSQVDVTRVTLYRRQAGKVTVQKLMTSDPRITAVRDYAALNGNTYTYTLVGETDGGSSTSAISSNSVSPCIWNYTLMLCSQDANGFYHVQQEYRFSLDISSGSENNNNNPTLQQNFTRYPLRQPNAQNYRSGTLTSFVAKAVNGKYVDSLSEIDALREISTSTLYKFLKNRKGEIMMVDTASPITTTITDKYEQQPVRAAIPWAEIGNAKGKSVIAVSGDTYWPNN